MGTTTRALGPWAVAAVAFVVFANSLGNGFTYDDVFIVRDNPLVASGSARDAFTRPYWPEGSDGLFHPTLYRPLVILSYQWNRAWFGPGPLSFHLVNVLLHVAASVLVFRVGLALAASSTVALIAGLVFAVHPLHVEAVSGIVGRAELLAATLFLAALWVHARQPRFAPLLVFLFSLGACFSKEIAVTLPAAILVVARCRDRALARPALRDAALATAAAALLLAARTLVLGAPLDAGPGVWDGGETAVRLATALVALGKYTGLFFFPKTLSAEYSFDQVPLSSGVHDPRTLFGLLVLLLCLAAALRFLLFGRRSPVGGGLALFLVTYLPVSNFLFPLNVILAERLFYLPSVGVTIAIASAAAGLRLPGRLGAVLLAVALVALGTRSFLRNPVWANDLVLFEQTARDAPRCAKVWARLGQLRAEAGRETEAKQAYGRALEIDPDGYAALDGLGHLALEGAGEDDRERLEEALGWFREAARVHPTRADPFYNAGRVHQTGGRDAAARQAFEAALRIDPADSLSKVGLASAWQAAAVREAQTGRLARAESTLVRGIAQVRAVGGNADGMESMLAEIRAALVAEP